MNAICECNLCRHVWSCRAEDDPDTNSMELKEEQSCPECGSEDFDITDVEYDEP